MELEHSLIPYTKMNSKCIKGLNKWPDIIKLLEEDIGRTLFDINHSIILFDPPLRVMTIKAKIYQWKWIIFKTFAQEIKPFLKMKRQPIEWEKIFANDVTNQGLVIKIYKQLIQLTTKEKKSTHWKMGRRLT